MGGLATIVETCKLNGFNVEPYLNWALDQIAAKLPLSEYDKLLPRYAPGELLVGRQFEWDEDARPPQKKWPSGIWD